LILLINHRKMRDNVFDTVGVKSNTYNRFNYKGSHKSSGKMGQIIPIFVKDVIPGDIFKCGHDIMTRFLPLVAPVMHEVDIQVSTFYVSNESIWPEWSDFMLQKITGKPTIVPDGVQNEHLASYMGIPSGITDLALEIDALPFAAYAKIYDEYFVTPQIASEVFTEVVPGNNAYYQALAKSEPLYASWKKDYFTAGLPSPQAGPEVLIPLIQESAIDVTLKDAPTNPTIIRNRLTGNTAPSGTSFTTASGGIFEGTGGTDYVIDPNGNLEIELQAEAASIIALRTATAVMRYQELQMRTGASQRYQEFLMANYSERSKDLRIERPVHISTRTAPIVFSEVLATAYSTDDESNNNPLGTLGGHAIGMFSGTQETYKCPDFGWIMTVMVIRPRTSYFQGIDRMWSRETRFDYYTKEFANIGEQPVKNKEIYALNATNAENEATFSYMPAYASYMWQTDVVSGQMRDELLFWHLADEYGAQPVLNQDFLEARPSNRIFVDQDPSAHQIVFWIKHNVQAVRKIAKYAIPSI
jgi:hypothetical protein